MMLESSIELLPDCECAVTVVCLLLRLFLILLLPTLEKGDKDGLVDPKLILYYAHTVKCRLNPY